MILVITLMCVIFRLVRSKLLDIYIEKFIASDTPPCNKEDEHTQGKECGHTRSKADGHSQTQTPMLVDRGVQTDMVKITGKFQLILCPAP